MDLWNDLLCISFPPKSNCTGLFSLRLKTFSFVGVKDPWNCSGIVREGSLVAAE